MIIVGAGLAGLIAAHAWPRASIVEASPEPRQAHRALLRFRSEAVSRLTGIEFRRVLVRKGIWDTERRRFVEPNIRDANRYAQKCLGLLLGERSIWNLAPVERFIAPPDFYAQLVEAVGTRIAWGESFDWAFHAELPAAQPVVSTAPLPVVMSALGITPRDPFHRAAIQVFRMPVPGADVHQTVYFPAPDHPVYRASITGDTLIVEGVTSVVEPFEAGLDDVFTAFGISGPMMVGGAMTGGAMVEQKYGKIAPVADDARRKQVLFRLTHEHNIYSLGRFATWRNILLDDVVDDIVAIKQMIKSANPYDVRRALT